jgi:hypothetical protein
MSVVGTIFMQFSHFFRNSGGIYPGTTNAERALVIGEAIWTVLGLLLKVAMLVTDNPFLL